MKVVLNGGLNLSVADGWWEEAYDGNNGWSIVTPPGDAHAQDEHDAEALLDLMQNEVVPLFYARGPDGIPHRWVQRVKASMRGADPALQRRAHAARVRQPSLRQRGRRRRAPSAAADHGGGCAAGVIRARRVGAANGGGCP